MIPISTRHFIYEIGNLRLRGDVTIRCYQVMTSEDNKYMQPNTEQRELMFSVQFHTCAVAEKEIQFGRSDLDFACNDPRFPVDHRLTLNFGNENRGVYIQSPLIRIEPAGGITTYDSFENLNDGKSRNHIKIKFFQLANI